MFYQLSHSEETIRFNTEQEAIEYSIETILQIMEFNLDNKEIVEIYNLIKDYKYREAIDLYNSKFHEYYDRFEISILNISPYKSHIEKYLFRIEQLIKIMVFE